VAIVAVLAVFSVGVVTGSSGVVGLRVPTSTGDGFVGAQVATLWLGDTAYGAEASVAWRDASGAEHESGWPECLSTPGEVKGLRFQGAVAWHENTGIATILWVDCQGR
jgi:hypothetical protein